ncbi:hypothetical protein BC835DRAFT_1334444 [Cytidiella melzeri]|nr:hypothetical protein BC835DRAFT_1334444 [Cytidiella melzeri]
MRLSSITHGLGLSILSSAVATSTVNVDVISGQTHTGSSTVQFVSGSSGWDGPMVRNLNDTTFDMWYFDVLSTDIQTVFIFFTANTSALFPGLPDLDTATWLLATVTFPNGSLFETIVTADRLTVTTDGDGSSGTFPGGVAAWTGTPDTSTYALTFNAPDAGLSGTVTMKSTAPAHFPCAPTSAGAGQTLKLGQSLGWFNAVPDARAKVNLNVSGTPVEYSGHGYHDKNWGSVPERDTLRSWYWGRASLGPYSVVWFDYIDLEGNEGASGYVSQDGKILTSTCAGVRVRPTSLTASGAIYPPTPTTPLPDGFSVTIGVPGQGTFILAAQSSRVVSEGEGLDVRWVGTVSGGFAGQQQYKGIGMFEQFTFS